MAIHPQARFLSIMQREHDMQGLQLPSSCRSRIEQMVSRGVTRMRTNRILDNPGQVLQAEQNLKELIRYLCAFARDAGVFPEMTDADFDKAMLTCPPLFPWHST